MPPTATASYLHATVLSRTPSWSWTTWLAVVCISFVAATSLSVAGWRTIVKRRTSIIARQRGGRDGTRAPLIGPQNDIHTEVTVALVVEQTADEDVKPLKTPRPQSRPNLYDHLARTLLPTCSSDIAELSDGSFITCSLLRNPSVALASRPPDALATLLEYDTNHSEEPIDAKPEHSPVPSVMTDSSSIEDSLLLRTPSPNTGVLPQFFDTGSMMTGEEECSFAAIEGRSEIDWPVIKRRTLLPFTVPSGGSNPPTGNSEHVDEATDRTSLIHGPEVTRTPEQIAFMHLYGLDYIDARIAAITGHAPSPSLPISHLGAESLCTVPSHMLEASLRPPTLPIMPVFAAQAKPAVMGKNSTKRARYTLPPRMATGQWEVRAARRMGLRTLR